MCKSKPFMPFTGFEHEVKIACVMSTEVNVMCKCEEFCENYGDFYNHLKKQCFSVNFHPSHYGCSQVQNLSGDELVDHIKNCENISLSCQECK